MLNKIARKIGTLRIALDKETITAGMVHDSIDRLNEGSYGKCDSCGLNISTVRLAANPAARLCSECQAQAAPSAFILDRIFVHLLR